MPTLDKSDAGFNNVLRHDMPITHREARYISERLLGTDKGKALLKAGFSVWQARCPAQIETPDITAKIEELQRELVNHALAVGLADAKELHETLSCRLRGRVSELYDEAGELLPIHEWPEWAQNGGVEVVDAPNMVPSKDGDSASWDQVGRKKIVKTLPREKAWEMLGKLKAVDAFKEQSRGDINLNITLEQEKVREKLASARKRRAARIMEAEAKALTEGANEDAVSPLESDTRT